MPVAVPIIAAAAAYGATALAVAEGVVIAGSFGAAVIGATASFVTATALGAAFSSGGPSPSSPDFSQALTQPGGGRTQQVRQPVSPHLIPYGRIKLSGPITFTHSKDDDGGRANGYLYLIHTLAAVEVKAIGDVYLQDSLSTDEKYSGLVRIGKHLGAADQLADADLVSEIAGDDWTSNHRGRGRAYIATRLKWSQEAFAGGIPNVAAIVDGVDTIYDPRDGTTAFTNNAALCIANWFTSVYGMELAWSKLNEASVIAAANVCDERVRVFGETTTFAVESGSPSTHSVTLAAGSRVLDWGDGVRVSSSGELPVGLAVDTTYYVIPAANGTIKFASSFAHAFAETPVSMGSAGTGTLTLQYWDEARYKCNGSFTLDSPKRDVLEQLLSSMAGVAVYLGGQWYIHAGAASTPTVTLTADDLRGDYSYTPKRSVRDRWNGVRAVMVNPDKSWQPTDLPPLAPTAELLAEDGNEELYSDIRFSFTTSARCAQRLMKIHLMRNRAQGVIEFPAKLTAFRLTPWDGVYFTIGRGDNTYALEDAQFRISNWALSEDGGVDLVGAEDNADVYSWDVSEEQVISVAQDVVLPDPSAVTAPASITVTTPTTPTFTTIAFEWTSTPSIWLAGYDVEYREQGASDWIGYGRVGGIDGAAQMSSVDRSTPQDFQVRSVNTNGATSAFTQNLAPAAPTGVAVVGTAINYTNAAGAATVQVFKNAANTFAGSTLFTTIDPASTATVSVDDDAYYWLRSVNAGGNISAPTTTVTVGAP